MLWTKVALALEGLRMVVKRLNDGDDDDAIDDDDDDEDDIDAYDADVA